MSSSYNKCRNQTKQGKKDEDEEASVSQFYNKKPAEKRAGAEFHYFYDC